MQKNKQPKTKQKKKTLPFLLLYSVEPSFSPGRAFSPTLGDVIIPLACTFAQNSTKAPELVGSVSA